MVVLVLAHMTQVFLQGAYKYPRELTWVVGVLLLLCTLGMFFTGQVLRWDPDAYWGLAVAGSMAGRVPGFGPQVVRLLLGGPIIGGDSLSRFFALHVFVIPGSLLGLLAIHLWLVLKCGISAPPVPGELVDPATYDADYHAELKTGVPFLGDAMLKDALFQRGGGDCGRGAGRSAGPQRAHRSARSDARGRQSATGVAVFVALCAALVEPTGGRDVHHLDLSADFDRGPCWRCLS